MLKLEIVTPEKSVLDAEVDMVTIPTASGEAGILPNHAPMVSALKPGILAYSSRDSSDRLAVTGGFVEINADKVSVLADSAETSAEIDPEEARVARDAAEKAAAAVASGTLEEIDAAHTQLDAANVRLQLATGK